MDRPQHQRLRGPDTPPGTNTRVHVAGVLEFAPRL